MIRYAVILILVCVIISQEQKLGRLRGDSIVQASTKLQLPAGFNLVHPSDPKLKRCYLYKTLNSDGFVAMFEGSMCRYNAKIFADMHAEAFGIPLSLVDERIRDRF